jgi:heat-inducible transcriptional repressor
MSKQQEPPEEQTKEKGLDDRKEQVLKAVVDDYTTTAVPVGSQILAERYFARWSSATIRNELARLMETGHLQQPHTSSGRIPSDRGYRYFVNFLMEEEPLDPALRARLRKTYESLPLDVEAILEATAMAVAQAVDSVGVVTAPRTSECRLKHLDLVHLDGPRILALVVLEGNLVRQQPLDLPLEIDQQRLAELSARLNHDLKGRTRSEIRTYLDAAGLELWQIAAVAGVAEFMDAYDDQSAAVVVHDGVRNLLRHPEFVGPDRLLPVLEMLEHSRDLARVLEAVGPEVEVMIGDENPDSHLRGCSLVMTTYGAAESHGTIGAIGPTRMRYPQVVVRVRYISQLAGEAIARVYG